MLIINRTVRSTQKDRKGGNLGSEMGISVEGPKNESSLAVFMSSLAEGFSEKANRRTGGNGKTHLSLFSKALLKSPPRPVLIRLF